MSDDKPNGTNGHLVTRPHVHRAPLIDLTSFPTAADVARQAGVAHQSVRRWQKAGKLTPIEDAEGTTRYDPEEVDSFLRARDELIDLGGDGSAVPTRERNVQNELLLYPRLKIDDLFFKLLDRYEKRNAFLESQVDHLLTAKEANISTAAERDMVATTLRTEAEMKQGLATALSDAVPKVMAILDRHSVKKAGGDAPVNDLDDFTQDELKLILLTTGSELGEARQERIFRKIQEKQRKEAGEKKTPATSEASTSSSTTPATPASTSEGASKA